MNAIERKWNRSMLKPLATALTAVALLAGCRGNAPAAREPVPPRVVVAEVRRATLPVTATSNGTTRAIEEVTLRARVTGFLKEVRFKEGADVKKGQLLLVIDEEPFQVKLEAAKANLAEAEASLRKALDSKAREMAKAQVSIDQAQLNLAVVELGRSRALYERKAATLEEVDRNDAVQKKNAAQVEFAKANLEQANTDFDIAIASGRANVDKAKAAVRDAQIELGYCRMESPIDGRVGELFVKVGNLVTTTPATEMATIRQLDPIGLDIHASSRYLPKIMDLMSRGGAPVKMLVQGEREHPYPGQVAFVDNQVDPATSTVLLRVEAANPGRTLLPGEYVKTQCAVGLYQDALVVPEKAVVEAQDGFSVFTVDDKGMVDRTKVVPLDTVDGMRVVESGVTVGQKVVVDGIQLVRKGSKVQAETRPFGPTPASTAAPTPAKSDVPAEAAKPKPAPAPVPAPAVEKRP